MGWAERIVSACVQTWGETIQYQCATGQTYTLRAIVDMTYQALDVDSGALVQSHHPKIGIRAGDLMAEPQLEDRIILRNKTYRIAEYQPDGQGGAELFLQEV